MTIELRVTVTPEDIKSLYTEEREPFLAAMKSSSNAGYEPNLLINPLVLAGNCISSLFVDEVARQVGMGTCGKLRTFLEEADAGRRGLLSTVAVGKENIDSLVNGHFSELQAFPKHFAMMGKVDTRCMDDNTASLFSIGLLGLAFGAIYGNELYGPTRREFLQQVRNGVVEAAYNGGISAVLQSAGGKISGKDVLRLFSKHSEQRESVRQALLYRMEGKEGEGICASDLLAQPAFAANMLETRTISGYLSERGIQKHELLTVRGIASTFSMLVYRLDGGSGKSSSMTERQFKMLASRHAGQLSRLTDFYRRLSEIDFSALSGKDTALFGLGMENLLRVMVRAKAMYHPKTSAGFLQHVQGSALERPYDLGMLAAARSIVPKTL